MCATSTFDWQGPERARFYRALAEMLSLSEGSVSEPVHTLCEMACNDMIMPSRTTSIDAQVRAWVAEGERPPLNELLRSLFGVGFCSKELPIIPACAAFYVRDADAVRIRLREAHARWGYHESRIFAPECEGVGYVASQLEFVAHCIETGCPDDGGLETVAELLRESLFDWAPLFARALVVARTHPAVMFVGMKLECLLAHEHELSQPALAD